MLLPKHSLQGTVGGCGCDGLIYLPVPCFSLNGSRWTHCHCTSDLVRCPAESYLPLPSKPGDKDFTGINIDTLFASDLEVREGNE